MNNKLMEVTDNLGIVTDDIGKMRAVMASSGKDMEDILRRKNILEEDKSKLEQINNKLEDYEYSKRDALYLFITAIVSYIFIGIIARTSFDFKEFTFLFSISSGMIFFPIVYSRLGNIFTLRKRINLLRKDKKELEESIPKLEEELERLKEQVEFQELDDIEIKDLESSQSDVLESTNGIYRQIVNDANGIYENNVFEKNKSFNNDSSSEEKPHTLSLRKKY